MRSDYLSHHGILGQKWGHKNGPPYPLDAKDHSKAEKKAKTKKNHNILVSSARSTIKNDLTSFRHPIRTFKGNTKAEVQQFLHPVSSLKLSGKSIKASAKLVTSRKFRKKWNEALNKHYLQDPNGSTVRIGKDYIKKMGNMTLDEIMNDHDAFIGFRELYMK